MNDRQLLSFIKIVETGSFSKAAKDKVERGISF